eukprot:1133924-Pyramimonas_sp.AAC.1
MRLFRGPKTLFRGPRRLFRGAQKALQGAFRDQAALQGGPRSSSGSRQEAHEALQRAVRRPT